MMTALAALAKIANSSATPATVSLRGSPKAPVPPAMREQRGTSVPPVSASESMYAKPRSPRPSHGARRGPRSVVGRLRTSGIGALLGLEGLVLVVGDRPPEHVIDRSVEPAQALGV